MPRDFINNDLENQITQLKKRIVYEADRGDRLELQTLELKDRLREKKRALDKSQAEIEALRETIRHLARDQSASPCENAESCTGADTGLCGRCIAYVGGQNKQAKFFKDYVEGQNGQFLHHDGGLHDGQARLDSVLEKADAVMFPVSCVSHEAAKKIKQLCLRHKKPFIPLRTQGLAAFTRGLESLNGEYFSKSQA